jgi:hypothetical protein
MGTYSDTLSSKGLGRLAGDEVLEIDHSTTSALHRDGAGEIVQTRNLFDDVYTDAGDGRTIVRELVQNADDAEATRLTLALVERGVSSAPLHRAVVGAVRGGDDWRLLVDWQPVSLLNPPRAQPDRPALRCARPAPASPRDEEMQAAFAAVVRSLDTLDPPFRRPVLRLHSALVPR